MIEENKYNNNANQYHKSYLNTFLHSLCNIIKLHVLSAICRKNARM